MRERAAQLGLWAVLATSGCSSATVFFCHADGDCAGNEAAGFCEEDGYCSFPDSTCPSGRRYGEFAAASLALTCVPSDTRPTDATSGTSTASLISATAVGTTLGDALEESGNTTQELGTSEDGSSSSSSTGEEFVGCVIDETFDGMELDRAWSTFGPGTLSVAAGVLTISVIGDPAAYSGLYRTVLTDGQPFTVTAEVGGVPAPEQPASMGICILNVAVATQYCVSFFADTLACSTTVDGLGSQDCSRPYVFSPVAVRIRYDGTDLIYQADFDGGFEEIHRNLDVELIEAVYAEVNAGAWDLALEPGSAVLGSISLCAD